MEHTNTIISSRGTDVIEINTVVELPDVNVHVNIGPDMITIYHDVTLDMISDYVVHDQNELLDIYTDAYDRIDGIKYYQNFEGFKNVDMTQDDCIAVIDIITELIEKYRFYSASKCCKLDHIEADDESSWYYRLKQTAVYKQRMFLKEIYYDRYHGFSTMHDGNVYQYVSCDDGSADFMDVTTGEVHKILNTYKNDEDAYVYEVER